MLAGISMLQGGQAATPPNILFVRIDDLGWMDLRVHGNRAVHTPHVDQLAADGMMRRGRLGPPNSPGVYTLKLTAAAEGDTLSAEHQFQVQARDIESLEVLANFELLARIADISGGSFRPIRQLDGLLACIGRISQPATREIIKSNGLADFAAVRWLVVMTVVGLLCLEWAARKRRGLV